MTITPYSGKKVVSDFNLAEVEHEGETFVVAFEIEWRGVIPWQLFKPTGERISFSPEFRSKFAWAMSETLF